VLTNDRGPAPNPQSVVVAARCPCRPHDICEFESFRLNQPVYGECIGLASRRALLGLASARFRSRQTYGGPAPNNGDVRFSQHWRVVHPEPQGWYSETYPKRGIDDAGPTAALNDENTAVGGFHGTGWRSSRR
jgi:hypothetical protein